ncbi:MAG: serine/threonine protein kinase [Planctomycetes bacterium]|nr:serine/threonine protein kinase [Planctomycetota bacterium]
MSPLRHRDALETRAHEVVLAAFQASPDERDHVVAALCRGSPQVERRVNELLARAAAIDGFLEPDRETALDDERGAHRALKILRPGDRLGEFVIVAALAIGGTSVVFRAHHESDPSDEVALKVVGIDEDAPLRTLAHCQREAAIALRMRHPGLPRMRGCGHDATRGVHWMAQELIEGPLLSDLLIARAGAGSLRASEGDRAILALSLRIAEALATLHRHGIAHRDVSPRNVVLRRSETDATPEPVLIDFGLARETASATPVTRAVTEGYAAPEAFRSARADRRSDVFALGWLIHDLLAGCTHDTRPRDDSGRAASLRRTAPHVEARLADLVSCMTSNCAALRPRHAGVVVRALRGFQTGRRSLASALQWRARAALSTEGAARRLRRIALALGLLAVLTGCGVHGWIHERALGEGDLSRAERARARLGWIAEVLRPAQARDPALDAVAMSVRSGDLEDARWRAARALARDGAHVHPLLVRFLARELAATSDANASRLRATLAPVARFCVENPALDPASLASLAPLREALLSILRPDRPVPAIAAAVSALAACGDLSALPELLAWAGSREVTASPDSAEASRLVAIAAARILTRAEACGTDPEGTARVAAPVWSRLLALLGPASEAGDPLSIARRELEFAVARCARDAGSAIPSCHDLSARAIAADPGLAAELSTQGPGRVLAEPGSPAAALLACTGYGELVACFGDPGLEDLGRDHLTRFAARLALDAASAIERFETGVAQGRRLRTAPWPFPLLDADTRMEFTPSRAERARTAFPMARIPAETGVEGGPRNPVADADLEYRPARVAGSVLAIGTSDATFDVDPLTPGRGYVRLRPRPGSGIALRFDVGGRALENLRVMVYAQKGDRRILPFGGHAALDVDCDGHPIARDRTVGGRVAHELEIAIDRLASGGEHLVELRAAPGCETTIRVYAIRVVVR